MLRVRMEGVIAGTQGSVCGIAEGDIAFHRSFLEHRYLLLLFSRHLCELILKDPEGLGGLSLRPAMLPQSSLYVLVIQGILLFEFALVFSDSIFFM